MQRSVKTRMAVGWCLSRSPPSRGSFSPPGDRASRPRQLQELALLLETDSVQAGCSTKKWTAFLWSFPCKSRCDQAGTGVASRGNNSTLEVSMSSYVLTCDLAFHPETGKLCGLFLR